MKKLKELSIVGVLVALMGCATTNQSAKKSVFTFNYENQTYEIISLNTQSGEGTNILTLVGGNERISARDLNQDGVLDVVIQGNTHIDVLNSIYLAGIDIARSSGNYSERQALRQFEWEQESYTLIISTYFYNQNEVNNQFIIVFSETGQEAMFTDLMADGTLDEWDKGNVEITRAQKLYEMTLLKGIDEGRIQKNENFYEVLLRNQMNASTQKEQVSFLN